MVLASSEGSVQVVFFLFQQLVVGTYRLGPVFQGVNCTKLGRQVMVSVSTQVQDCMCGASYTLMLTGIIRLWHYYCVQERKDPSALASSVVKWMCGSTLLMCSRNHSFFTASMTTKLSSTHLPKSWWVFSCIDDLDIKILHIEVGHNGDDGRSHSCSL